MNRHRIGTDVTQTRSDLGGIVDREGGGPVPTLGWGAGVDASTRVMACAATSVVARRRG